MHPLREQARNLRQRGKSYHEIETRLGIGRSTLAYMLRDIQLTEVQKARLDRRQRRNQIHFGESQRRFWNKTSGRSDNPKQAARREIMRQRRLAYCHARTGAELETFKSKMRAAAARRYKPHNPIQPPRTLDQATYRMCLRQAPLLGYHPNWNYVISRGNGYVAVKCPDHPRCTPRGYVPVHRLVLECKLKRPLLSKEVTHHLNGKPDDNRADNVTNTNPSEHAKAHARPCLMNQLVCSFCGKSFTRPKRRKIPLSGNVFDTQSCVARFYNLGRIGRPSPRRLPPEEKRRRKAAYVRRWRQRRREALDKSTTTC